MQLCSVSTVNNAWSELNNNSNTSTRFYNTACLVFYQACMTSLDSDDMSDRTSVKMTRPDQIRLTSPICLSTGTASKQTDYVPQ